MDQLPRAGGVLGRRWLVEREDILREIGRGDYLIATAFTSL
jgi:hypothetical protein